MGDVGWFVPCRSRGATRVENIRVRRHASGAKQLQALVSVPSSRSFGDEAEERIAVAVDFAGAHAGDGGEVGAGAGAGVGEGD